MKVLNLVNVLESIIAWRHVADVVPVRQYYFDCTGTFLQLVRLPLDVYRPEFGKNCKVCCAIGKKFACEAAFFFLFRRAVFRKSCLLETFHIWIGKNCDLVATINSLPHFDWKHAVLTLTPEYQVY